VIPFAEEIMMVFAGVTRGTFRFCCASLLCDASVLLAACPAANAAEVTASPEIKSLRFMGPHFCDQGETQKDIRSSGELLVRIGREYTRMNTNNQNGIRVLSR
jgi:hypothetical protein